MSYFVGAVSCSRVVCICKCNKCLPCDHCNPDSLSCMSVVDAQQTNHTISRLSPLSHVSGEVVMLILYQVSIL